MSNIQNFNHVRFGTISVCTRRGFNDFYMYDVKFTDQDTQYNPLPELGNNLLFIKEGKKWRVGLPGEKDYFSTPPISPEAKFQSFVDRVTKRAWLPNLKKAVQMAQAPGLKPRNIRNWRRSFQIAQELTRYPNIQFDIPFENPGFQQSSSDIKDCMKALKELKG
jgi:hypothetical protein